MSYPVSLVVNLDTSAQPGSHWIAMYITESHLEIFDSLGFKNTLESKPPFLLKFIEKLSLTHRIFITPPLQDPSSGLCGFYTIYFLLFRQFYSFAVCLSIFSDNLLLNDNILLDQLL